MKYKFPLIFLTLVSLAYGVGHIGDEKSGDAYSAEPFSYDKGYKKDFYYWFDEGLDAYYAKDYKKAADSWDKSYKLAKNDESKISSLVNKALALAGMDKNKEAVALHNAIQKKLKKYKNGDLRLYGAKSLYNMGYVLGNMGKYKEEIAAYDKLYDEFASVKDSYVAADVAAGLFNKGYRLDAMGRHPEAIDAYDKIINEFSASDAVEVVVQVAKAYCSKGYALGSMERFDEEVKVLEHMYTEFGSSNEPVIMAEVALGLVNRGYALGKLGKIQEEIAIYDMLYEQFGNKEQNAFVGSYGNMEDIKEDISIHLSTALFNKAYALGTLGKRDEEIAVYKKVYEEFGASKNDSVRIQVAKALNNCGIALSKDGKNTEAEKFYLKSIETRPQDVEIGAYTNIFELYVMLGKDFDKGVEQQFLKYAKKDKRSMLQYQMAATVKASLAAEQSDKIKRLKKEYKGVKFGDWSWVEIETWAETLKDEAAKSRAKSTILTFKEWDKN